MPVLPSRLYVRAHGVFYLRLITPKALQATTGKRETWHSLRTKDPQEAKVLALSYALELERAKAGMGSKKGVIKGAIAEAAEQIADPLKITTPDGYTVDFDATQPAEKAEALAFLAQHKAPEISEAQRLAWQAQEIAQLRDTEAAFRRTEAEAQYAFEASIGDGKAQARCCRSRIRSGTRRSNEKRPCCSPSSTRLRIPEQRDQ